MEELHTIVDLSDPDEIRRDIDACATRWQLEKPWITRTMHRTVRVWRQAPAMRASRQWAPVFLRTAGGTGVRGDAEQSPSIEDWRHWRCDLQTAPDLATFPDVCGGEGGDPVGTAPSENRLPRRLYALSRGQTTGRGSAAHARHARRPGEPFDPEPRGSRARSTCQPTGLTSSERGEAAVMSRATAMPQLTLSAQPTSR